MTKEISHPLTGPEPMTAAEMDMRDLDGFMLNVERLLASELWALTKECPGAFRGAVGLWARAWKQIPPASLPDNEVVIAAYADMPLAKFRKLRELVMRGFELCSDGRWYHRKLAEEVCKVWPSVMKRRRDRAADNERLKQWRERKRGGLETKLETDNETDGETGMKRISPRVDRDRDTDRDKERNTSLRSDSRSNVHELHLPKPPLGGKRGKEPDGFAEFYEAFPLKKARGAALKAWPKAAAKAFPAEIIAGAKRYARSRKGEDQKYTAHPATWLSDERWLDDLPGISVDGSPALTVANGRMPGESPEHFKVRRFKEIGLWLSPDGPPPTDPDCCMPQAVLIEFGYRQDVSRETGKA